VRENTAEFLLQYLICWSPNLQLWERRGAPCSTTFPKAEDLDSCFIPKGIDYYTKKFILQYLLLRSLDFLTTRLCYLIGLDYCYYLNFKFHIKDHLILKVTTKVRLYGRE